jgi:hypothetical protein
VAARGVIGASGHLTFRPTEHSGFLLARMRSSDLPASFNAALDSFCHPPAMHLGSLLGSKGGSSKRVATWRLQARSLDHSHAR